MFHDIEKKNFLKYEKILKNLKKNYNFVNPKNLNNLNQHGNILLTFDDGFESNYFFAKKVLNKLKIKAIFFIVTDLLEKKIKKILSRIVSKNSKQNYKFLKKKQIKELIKMGHLIGAHGKAHLRLSEISNFKDLKEEIILPKKKILQQFKKKTDFFAYPYGDIKSIDKRSANIIFREYKYLFTGIRGDNKVKTKKNNILFRENIVNSYSKSIIELFIRGYLDFRYFFDRKKILKY